MSTIEEYIEALYPQDANLTRVKQSLSENGMQDISIASGYGRLLTLLVKMSGASRILEIGALGGYSGISLARGLSQNGSLLSLELMPDYAAVAKENMEQAGFGDMVSYRTGDAQESLKQLQEEGARFDFFFIDADKKGYPTYLEAAISLANEGAVIVADNVLSRGRVSDPERSGPGLDAIRAYNQQAASDPRLISTLLPGYDGLSISIVKGQNG